MADVIPFPVRKQVNPQCTRIYRSLPGRVEVETVFPDGTKLIEFFTAEEAADIADDLLAASADAINLLSRK